MRNILWLLTLLPSLIFAQSIGADAKIFREVFFNGQSNNNHEFVKTLKNESYVSEFTILTYNSTLDKDVKCNFNIYYSFSENKIIIDGYKKLSCAKGFSLTSIKKQEQENQTIKIKIYWKYESYEKVNRFVIGNSKVASDDIFYTEPVDQENTIIDRPSIVYFNSDGVDIDQRGGNLFGKSGLFFRKELTNGYIESTDFIHNPLNPKF